MGNFDKYVFRCSSLGDIMTNSRDRKSMGGTCKTKLIQIWWKEMYGVEKPISTKQMDKGITMESDAIDLLGKVVYPGEYLLNNKKRITNEFVTGECDVERAEVIHDAKVSWDVETYSKAVLTKGYEYQGRGYMWLYDKPFFELNPCLLSTPEHLIMDELRRIAYYLNDHEGTSDRYMELEAQIYKNMKFDHIPESLRLKRIRISRDTKIEDKIMVRVLECRKWLNNYDPSKPEK